MLNKIYNRLKTRKVTKNPTNSQHDKKKTKKTKPKLDNIEEIIDKNLASAFQLIGTQMPVINVS